MRLYLGSAAGSAVNLTTYNIDLDQLTPNTDYIIDDSRTFTQGDETLQTYVIRLTLTGIQKTLNVATVRGLGILPEYTYGDMGGGIYAPNFNAESVPVGSQPADWISGNGWRYLYFTRGVYTAGDYTGYGYAPASETWASATQYYRITDAARFFYTPGGSCFGMGRANLQTGATMRTYTAALQQSQFGSSGGKMWAARWGGLSGIRVDTWTDAPAFRNPLFAQRDFTFNTDYVNNDNICMVVIRLNGEDFPGTMLYYSVNHDAGVIDHAGIWCAGSAFWGETPPPTPGDWGEESKPLTPSGGVPVTFNANLISPVTPWINQAVYGTSAGGIQCYVLTDSQYGAVMGYMWDQSFIDRLLRFGGEPGSGVLAVHMLPIPTNFNTYHGGTGASWVHIAGVSMTGCTGDIMTRRIMEIDCGTVDVSPYSGTFSDYDAECSIYLPFVGEYTLDIKKIMRGRLSLIYRVDSFTGDCLAILSVTPQYPDGVTLPSAQSVLLIASGNAAFNVPFAYTDGAVQQRLQALSGALSASIAAVSGNPGGLIGAATSIFSMGAQSVSASGVSGGAGAFGMLTPYIWIKYPDMINPAAYTETVGRMTGGGGTVGSAEISGETALLSGYQKYKSVDISGIDCTDAESAEIERLLMSGVYINRG